MNPKTPSFFNSLILSFFNSFIIVIALFHLSFTNKADSLKTALANTKEDTTRINLLNNLGWELMYQNPDTSILLGKKALELAEHLPTPKGKGLGVRSKLIANSNSNLGVYYGLKGDYPLSLSCHFKALEIRKQLNNKKGIAVSLGNIGLVYWNQGDYPNALKYYFEALEIDKELGNKNGMASDLGNIGIVYIEQGDYPNALKYFFDALEIAKELGNKNRIAIQLGNIGNVYAEQANAAKYRQDIAGSDSLYAKALQHYFEALEIDKELGKKSGIAIKLGNIGSLYTQTGRFKEAEVYLDSALAICYNIGVLNYTMLFEEASSQLYDTTARYQLAYHHYKKYRTAKDSLFNEEKSKEIGRLEQNHELEIAELERERMEKEKSRQEAAAVSRRNILQYSGILLTLVFLFMGIFLLARRFRKIKASVIASAAKSHLTGDHPQGWQSPDKSNWRRLLQSFLLRNDVKIIEVTLFISFLIFFEFILVLIDPYLEKLTGGEPAFKLLTNAVLAGVIFLLHNLLETKLKGSVVGREVGSLKSEDGSWEQKENSGSKTLLLIVGFGLISLLHNSFSDKTDSLKIAIGNAKEDNAKVNLLNNLGWELMYQNPDSSILLGKKALELAERLPSHLGEGLGVRSKLIANSNSNLGVYYYLKGDYPLSLSYYLKAIEIQRQINDKKGITVSLGNIGIVYKNQGNYPKALKHFFEVVVIDKEMGDKAGMAAGLNNIGLVYSEQANAAKSRHDIAVSDSLYTKTLKYYFEALEIAKELGNKNGIAICLGNIGIVYSEQANAAKFRQDIVVSDSLYAKALKHYFEALEIYKEMGNKRGMAICLDNIGLVYKEQADAAKFRQDISGSNSLYTKALKHCLEALEIDKELGNKNGMAIDFGNIGSLYTETGRFKEAEAYLDSALVIDLEIGSISGQMHRHEALSNLYDTTAHYQLAYHHYKKYSTAKDSLFNEEKSKEIGRLEQMHKFEIEELEREIMEKERSRQEAAAVGRRNLLQYSSIFLVLFFLFGMFFFIVKIPLPEWMVELSTFVPFMILFEFILVLLDPYIENITGGEPLYTLLINAFCAAIIFPIHSFFEKKLKSRIYKIKKEKEEKYAEEFRKEAEKYGGR